jgi:crotonobetainyl-CoA:carnitine CoA-transferase CaiB-like acyl-CoA transferase
LQPLTRICVVDLSRNVAGPFAAMLLGDLGADVVKVERPPHGDDARRHGPPFVAGESPYFLSLNRNKRSIVLDLKRAAGREAVWGLLERADIAIFNQRPEALARLGFAPDRLAQRNARLIVARITGFGTQGPWAQRPAYDHIVQGMSGLMSITGTEAGGPVRVGVSISDVLTGLYAAYGLLAALQARTETGKGQVVDVSLLGATIASLTFRAGQYLANGERPRPLGNDHPMIAPYGTFGTADGRLNLAVGNDGMFVRLCTALGVGELAADVRFASNAERVSNRPALHAAIEARLRTRSTGDWVEILGRADVACGPVLAIDEALSHPAAEALGVLQEVEHPAAGRLRLLGFPVKLSATPASTRRPPPLLGEHSHEVLTGLGYSADDIARLEEEGVLG